MADDRGKVPKYNAPSSRVMIAFPFAKIQVSEPDARMKELASIVVDLARSLAKVSPGAGADELVERAQGCLAALEG